MKSALILFSAASHPHKTYIILHKHVNAWGLKSQSATSWSGTSDPFIPSVKVPDISRTKHHCTRFDSA